MKRKLRNNIYAYTIIAFIASTLSVFSVLIITRAPIVQDGSSQGFALIFFDDKTDQMLGSFPSGRKPLSSIIKKLNKLKARAIVFKFLLDEPSNPNDDGEFRDSIEQSKIPIVLEASFECPSRFENPFPEASRMTVIAANRANVTSIVSGGSVPLEAFSAAASKVGFGDIMSTDKILVGGMYRGQWVKSLITCSLECRYGNAAIVQPGSFAKWGDERQVKLNENSEIGVTLPKHTVAGGRNVADLLDDRISERELRDRVVIVGYRGSRSPMFHTTDGDKTSLDCFWLMLLQAHKDIESKKLLERKE